MRDNNDLLIVDHCSVAQIHVSPLFWQPQTCPAPVPIAEEDEGEVVAEDLGEDGLEPALAPDEAGDVVVHNLVQGHAVAVAVLAARAVGGRVKVKLLEADL